MSPHLHRSPATFRRIALTWVTIGTCALGLIDAQAADLLTIGDGSLGQLADGTYAAPPTPTAVLSGVLATSVGGEHTLILKTDHTLWAVGHNDEGQLGDGSLVDRESPVKVAEDVIAISAGKKHSVFLKSDHSLWTTGSNSNGQLGDGTFVSRSTPQKVVDEVTLISANANRTLFVKSDGSLSGMGDLKAQFLGHVKNPWPLDHDVTALSGDWYLKGTTLYWFATSFAYIGSIDIALGKVATGVSAVSSQGDNVLYVKTDGSIWASRTDGAFYYTLTPDVYPGTAPVQVDSSVSSAFAGPDFGYYTKSDGTVWALGRNDFGQLGDGSKTNRPAPVKISDTALSVSAGPNQTLFLKADGSLLASGDNRFGQLADGKPTSRSLPKVVLTDVAVTSAGTSHLLILKDDHTLWAAGSNSAGQLGDGSTTDRATPVSIATDVTAVSAGDSHSVFLKSDGSLWAMGNNGSGQLGDGTTSSRLAPVKIAEAVSSVSAGGSHTVFVKTNGTLWAVGSNDSGQLGNGTLVNATTPIQIATLVSTAAAGLRHTAFIKTDMSLWVCGKNDRGQLGDETGIDHQSPVKIAPGITQVVASANQTAFIDDQQTLWSAGDAVDVDISYVNPKRKPEVIDTLVVSISAGQGHVFYTKADGLLRGAGRNDFGELGSPTWVTNFLSGTNLMQVNGIVRSASIGARFGAIVADTAALPEITASPSDAVVPEGSPAKIAAASKGGREFRWYKDGIALSEDINPSATSATLSFTSFTAADVGAYKLKSTNANGSVFSAEATLTLGPSQGYALKIFGGLVPDATVHYATPHFVAKGVTEIAADAALLPDKSLWQFALLNRPPDFGLKPLSDNIRFFSGPGGHLNLYGDQNGRLWSSIPYNLPFIPYWRGNSLALADAKSATCTTFGGYTLIIKSDATLWAMGANWYGQLGDGTTEDRTTPVQIATNVSQVMNQLETGIFLKNDGTLWLLGTPFSDPMSPVPVRSNVPVLLTSNVKAASLSEHLLVLKNDGTLWGLGNNYDGQLGDGTQTWRSNFVKIASGVKSAVAGGGYSLFVKTDGTVWAMGINTSEQLGDGTTIRRLSPVQIARRGIAVGAGPGFSSLLTELTPLAPLFTRDPASATVASTGDHVELEGFALDAYSYQWYKDGVAVQGATTNRLIFASAVASDSGDYVLEAINPTGSATSAKASLHVKVPAPVLAGHPTSVTTPTGNSVTLTASATGSGMTLQWFKDGVALAGETGATLTITHIQASDTGTYTLVATNEQASVSSRPARLTVGDPTPSRLVNLSVRSFTGYSGQHLIAGFVTSGGERPVLVRAVGNGLKSFGVQTTLNDPEISLHGKVNDLDTVLASNDNWGNGDQASTLSSVFNAVGAFPFGDDSLLDAALTKTVTGVNTVLVEPHVFDWEHNVGVVLAEVYDAGPISSSKLLNMSVRGETSRVGDSTLIAGFVIRGSEPKPILIRGIGRTLYAFGVYGAVYDPTIRLHTKLLGTDTVIASNDNWGDEPGAAAAFVQAGAFELPAGSNDSAIVTTLPEGNYTVVLEDTAGGGGVGLIEVYDLSP